jgi:hypothetical protein
LNSKNNNKKLDYQKKKDKKNNKKSELTQILEVSCESDDEEKLKNQLEYVPVKMKPKSFIDQLSITNPFSSQVKIGATQPKPP